MKKKILGMLIVLIIGSLFLSSQALAAWTQPKGRAYNQLSVSYYVNDHKWTTIQLNNDYTTRGIDSDKINRVRAAKFETISTSYYGEYGIVDSLTVFTSIPWKKVMLDGVRQNSNRTSVTGWGDIDLGLRYNLFRNLLGTGVLVSLQGAVKIPEAYEYGDPVMELSLGNGQYDTTFLLQMGRAFGKGYGWINGGYKYRFENNEFYPFKPSDQIRVLFGGGYPVTSWLSIRGYVDYTKSVGNATISEDLRVYALLQGRTRDVDKDNLLIRDTLGLEPTLTTVSGGLVFKITPKVQTVLSYARDLGGPDWEWAADWLRSKDTGRGETFSVSLVYRY